MKMRILRRIESNIVLIQRGWQGLSGVTTLYLVAHFLTPLDQGFYYTITALVGILLALDIGLTNILVPLAAKYASKTLQSDSLADDGVHYGIGKYALKWFFYTGILILLMSPLGLAFLNTQESYKNQNINLVWLLMILAVCANYMISPIVLLLEGSGRIVEVYSHRLYQGILASLITWAALIIGANIFAVVVIPLVVFLYNTIWLLKNHLTLIKKIKNSRYSFDWRRVIWPTQWRTGSNILINYLLVFIYIPIYYHIFGPKEAGQMGLTMGCINAIFVLSISPLVGQFPFMTRLISEDKRCEAKRLYKAELKKALVTYILLVAIMIIFLLLVGDPLITRMLSLPTILVIAIGMLFYLVACVQGYFMRAHLLDKSLRLNLITLFCMLIGGLVLSSFMGPWGVPLAMVLVFGGILFPGMTKIIRNING